MSSLPPRPWSAAALAAACSGRLHGDDFTISGVTIDSRAVRVGSLFVALVGERDGHDFIESARSAGAAGVLTMQPTANLGDIEVGDTARALTQLGQVARAALPDRVVGITGSSGKTSTKDLLAAIFLAEGPAASSETPRPPG